MLAELRFVTQLAVGVVFLTSAAVKVGDPRGFARGVSDYQVVWPFLATPLSFVVISLESWLAVVHLAGWALTIAVPIGIAMLAGFATGVGVNLARGRALPCYCFGRGSEFISGRSLVRLLLLISGEALLLTTNRIQYPRQFTRLPELALALFWAIVLLMTGSWLLSFGDLVALLRPMPQVKE